MIDLKTAIEIKEQYTETDDIYLCAGSIVFSFIWISEEKHGLIELATKFIKDNNLNRWESTSLFLFTTKNEEVGILDRRTIRLEFLNWWIKRLSQDNSIL